MVVDDYTRESLCLTADMTLPSGRVIRDLEAVIARRGLPTQCVSDNGPEFTSLAKLHWMRGLRIDWRYIDPSKPQPSAFVESFNSRLRALERDAVHFAQLGARRAQGVAARLQYRTVTSLARQSDAIAYAARIASLMQQAAALRSIEGFAARPVASPDLIGSNGALIPENWII